MLKSVSTLEANIESLGPHQESARLQGNEPQLSTLGTNCPAKLAPNGAHGLPTDRLTSKEAAGTLEG